EELKRTIGCVFPKNEEAQAEIKGRDLMTGLPRMISVTSSETIEAFDEVSRAIVETIHAILEETPPELVADISENGIVLTGGGCLLWGFDRLIESSTSIRTRCADDAELSVAYGIVKALDNIAELPDGPLNLARRKQLRG
ncbi:MAG: rod shape-determining protein, partial [bacterium]